MHSLSRRLLASAAVFAIAGALACNEQRPENAPDLTAESVSGPSTFNNSDLPYQEQPAPTAAPQVAAVAAPQPAGPERGKQLYQQLACITCHTTDGSRGLAPSFKGLYGSTATLADGSTVKVDDAYLQESILNPTAKIVQGFAPMMPSFAGRVRPEDLQSITAYLKTLK